MKVGRPTKYNDEINQRAKEYIDTAFIAEGDAVPMAAGMACFLGVSKRTIYYWADENPEFLHTLDEMQAKQERMLASKGLSGDFNSVITKLMLSNHGYSDKQNIDHTSKGESLNKPDLSKLSNEELRQIAELQRKVGISEA
jgi:hypothetical protein